ncbi:MAG: hypothetical protein Q7S00_05775, partial [bacterium]|nr:hypothetical protein [bacterium]
DSDGDTVTGTVAEVTDTDGIANNEFSYSTDDSLLPGAVYTFTIVGEASGVLSASSVPLSADITYSLTMTCPSSDTFDGGATINCWTFRNTTNLTNESDADAAAGEILFGDDDASHFTLTDLTTSFVTSFSSVTQMYKEIEGDFDIQVDLVSASLYNANATAGIWLDDGDFSRTGTNNWAGFRCSLQGNICVVADIADMDPIVGPACIGNSTDSPPTYMDSTLNLSLRVVREGDIFRCYYKESGDADWTNLGGDIEIISKTPDTVTASIHLDNGNSGEIAEVVFDNLIFNSGNAVDQN